LADCDGCGAQQYKPGLLGPKNTGLTTELRWLCGNCDRRQPVRVVAEPRPLWQWYPFAGLAFLLAIILTVLVVL
jgi:hypothetical protein